MAKDEKKMGNNDVNKEASPKKNVRRKLGLILRHLRPAALSLGLGILGTMLATLARTGFTQVIRFTVDGVLMGDGAVLPAFMQSLTTGQMLLGACVLALVIAVIEFGVTFMQDAYLPKGSEEFTKSLRDALYSRIQRLPYSWHVENSTGDIIQRCISDVEVVRSFVMDQLIDVLSVVFLIVVYLVVMFSMNVKMSLLAFAFAPIILGYSLLFYRHMATRFRESDEAEGALSAVVQENLTGVRVVRAFGRESDELRKFREKNNAYTALWTRVGDWMVAFYTAGDFLSMAQVFAIVLLGIQLCVKGEISLGIYLAFIHYTRDLSFPMRRLGRTVSEMSKAGVSLERLLYILESEEEKTNEAPQMADLHGDITFDHVSFSYGENDVLKDVSFTVRGGQTLGILGETGSGKSTIAFLLARLYEPKTGRITVDGVDIREMDLHTLRKGVGVVLQEPFLFSRTLAENIAITKDGASQEEIAWAAREACLDEAIGEFVDGYRTVVGERGVTLSGGQKQRTAIARTLLSGAPVMVFDDALSAVDAKTDASIRTRLREAAGEATMILIAHRVSTLMQCDQVIVLEDGRIIEQGAPEELLNQDGYFAKTAKMQTGATEEGVEA